MDSACFHYPEPFTHCVIQAKALTVSTTVSTLVNSVRRSRYALFSVIAVAWITAALSGSVPAMLVCSLLLAAQFFLHDASLNAAAVVEDSEISIFNPLFTTRFTLPQTSYAGA